MKQSTDGTQDTMTRNEEIQIIIDLTIGHGGVPIEGNVMDPSTFRMNYDRRGLAVLMDDLDEILANDP